LTNAEPEISTKARHTYIKSFLFSRSNTKSNSNTNSNIGNPAATGTESKQIASQGL